MCYDSTVYSKATIHLYLASITMGYITGSGHNAWYITLSVVFYPSYSRKTLFNYKKNHAITTIIMECACRPKLQRNETTRLLAHCTMVICRHNTIKYLSFNINNFSNGTDIPITQTMIPLKTFIKII